MASAYDFSVVKPNSVVDTYQAAASLVGVSPGVYVKLSAANTVALATAATDNVIGVLGSDVAATGDECAVVTNGPCRVLAGGVVAGTGSSTAGCVMSDSDGKSVAFSSGGGNRWFARLTEYHSSATTVAGTYYNAIFNAGGSAA